MSDIKNIFLSLNKTCFLLLFLSCFNFVYGGMSPCSGGAAGPRASKAAIASQPPIVLLPNAGTGLFAKVQIQIIIPSVPENAFTVLGGNLRKKAIRANTAGSITDQGGNTAIPASAQVQSTQLRAIRL